MPVSFLSVILRPRAVFWNVHGIKAVKHLRLVLDILTDEMPHFFDARYDTPMPKNIIVAVEIRPTLLPHHVGHSCVLHLVETCRTSSCQYRPASAALRFQAGVFGLTIIVTRNRA